MSEKPEKKDKKEEKVKAPKEEKEKKVKVPKEEKVKAKKDKKEKKLKNPAEYLDDKFGNLPAPEKLAALKRRKELIAAQLKYVDGEIAALEAKGTPVVAAPAPQ
eukprot:gene15679-18633_t